MKKETTPAKSEEKYNEELVSSALKEIKEIYHEKTHDTVYSLGKCLLEHFYGNDIENIRTNSPTEGKSLNKLSRECEASIPGLSRAWLYASVKLLVDQKDLDGCLEYKQLSISHKFQLLQIHDVEKKKDLAVTFFEEGMSVRKAIKLKSQYLVEHKGNKKRGSKKKERKKTLKALIKQPYLLAKSEFKEAKSPEAIQKLKAEDKRIILQDAETQLKEIEREMEKHKVSKIELMDLIKNLKSNE